MGEKKIYRDVRYKKMLNVRITPEMWKHIVEYCQAHEMTVSDFVRGAISSKLGRWYGRIRKKRVSLN